MRGSQRAFGGQRRDGYNADVSCDFFPSEERRPAHEYFLIPDAFARISSDRQADSLWGKEKSRPHVHRGVILLEKQKQIRMSLGETH